MSSNLDADGESSPPQPGAHLRRLGTAAIVIFAAVAFAPPAAAQGEFAFDSGATVLLANTPVNVTVTGPADRLEALTLRLRQDGEVRDYSSTVTDDGAIFEKLRRRARVSPSWNCGTRPS